VLSVCIQNAQPPTNRSTQSTNCPRNCTLEARKPKAQSPKTHTTAAATTTVAKGAPTSSNNNNNNAAVYSQQVKAIGLRLRLRYVTLRYITVKVTFFCSVSSFPASFSSPSDSVPYTGSLQIVVPIFIHLYIHIYIYLQTFLPGRHTAA